jgi:hypothetical protein
MYSWELCLKYNIVTYPNHYACKKNCLLVKFFVWIPSYTIDGVEMLPIDT